MVTQDTDNGQVLADLLQQLRAAFPSQQRVHDTVQVPPKPTTTMEMILVTPAVALNFLTNNRKNRTIRRQRVLQYARSMEHGRWMHTGEPIMFDTDGNLINGQHRLIAIVLSGKSIWMFVCDDLPSDVRTVIDGNKPRSAADLLLYARDIVGGTQQAAVLRAMYGYGTMQKTSTAVLPLLDNQVFLNAWDKYVDSILFTYSGVSSSKAPLTAPMLSVVARAYYHGEDPTLLKQFLHIVKTGLTDNISQRTNAPQILRTWILTATGIGGVRRRTTRAGSWSYRQELVLRTERALKHFIENKNISMILLPKQGGRRFWLIDSVETCTTI